MSTHILGIRHHGPGSARSVVDALTTLKPDVVLIEGPPEGESLLALASHPQMQPPVALLVYDPDNLVDALYYPFATFSPEWQALQYALENSIAVQFMDLPITHRLALQREQREQHALVKSDPPDEDAHDLPREDSDATEELPLWRNDPLSLLAQAAGYDDSERWWDHMIEERRDTRTVFDGIRDAMRSVREHIENESDYTPQPMELLREAYMRKILYVAEKQYDCVAVVCGAWHVPALEHRPPQKSDDALLKGLAKVKSVVTWVPWTYGRLSYNSGYGAGIHSPGWYHHLWSQRTDVGIHWLTRVARALREQDIDISSAHVIEAVRLADSLAALRDCPQPSLREFNDAVQSVMLFGETAVMQLVHEKLIVGERLGQVPAETPMMPLQKDLQAQQTRLRLKPSAADQALQLDLRKPNDLDRSQLFHRLNILNIPWGKQGERVSSKGTFKENWRVQWLPDFEVILIESGRWGNTIEQAASTAVIEKTVQTNDLRELAEWVNRVLLADLSAAVNSVIQRLQSLSALTADVLVLMQGVPPLARLLRYGDVRKTSLDDVNSVLRSMLTRIFIGLHNACCGINEESAEELFGHMQGVHEGVRLLDDAQMRDAWHRCLHQLVEAENLQGIIQGRSCRLLLDDGAYDDAVAARQLGIALSIANDPAYAAAWLEGFLRASGQLLIHDHRLWQLVDEWVSQLSDDRFLQLLPLLRRTFSSFETAERRQMGERVKHGKTTVVTAHTPSDVFDVHRAQATLPVLRQLLGLKDPT